MIGISRYCISLLCQITSPNARCIESARTIKNTYLQLGLLWLTCIFIYCIYFKHFLRIQYKIGQYLPCPIKQCGNEVLPVLKNPRILFDSFGTESPVQISYIASNPLQIGRIGAAFDIPLWLLYKRCLCTHLVKLTNPHEVCYPKKIRFHQAALNHTSVGTFDPFHHHASDDISIVAIASECWWLS